MIDFCLSARVLVALLPLSAFGCGASEPDGPGATDGSGGDDETPCVYDSLTIERVAQAEELLSRGCDRVAGNLVVRGTDLVDLAPLRSIRTIDGSLTIEYNGKLQSLDGLDRLETVGASVSVSANPQLQPLLDLPALRTIGRDLLVHENAGITRLGFRSLERVERHLRFWNNWKLPGCEVDRLAERIEVGGGVTNDGNSTVGCEGGE